MKEYARYTINCQHGPDSPLVWGKKIEIDTTKKQDLNSDNIAKFVKLLILSGEIKIPADTNCIHIYEQWYFKDKNKEEVVASELIPVDLIFVGKAKIDDKNRIVVKNEYHNLNVPLIGNYSLDNVVDLDEVTTKNNNL